MENLMMIFKGIFANDNSIKVGLCQFKDEDKTVKPAIIQRTVKKETKLSDLMRGQC